MSKSSDSSVPVKNNIVRAHVVIRGTRPFMQHQFTDESIPLEEQEKTGVAGNVPDEWHKSKMVTPDGQMYFRGDYIFSCLRNAGKYTKKGRGTLIPLIAATLQVEDNIVLIDRFVLPEGPKKNDYDAPVYLDVRPVRNPKTKARNIRYRLTASPGWQCEFTILWDKTVVSRGEMRNVLQDAAILQGLGDGLSIGMGRFEVLSYKELTDAEDTPAEGTVEPDETESAGTRRRKVRPVPVGSDGEDGAR